KQRGAVAAQPALVGAVLGATSPQQRPEARRVVGDLEVADLVPDDRLEHRGRGEQQPPVEAHRAGGGAACPAGALAADRQRGIASAGLCAESLQSSSDLVPRAAPVPALQRRAMVARGYEQPLATARHPLPPWLW